MSQSKQPPSTAPNVQDKRTPAPGVLPKNAQTWVVIGLTAIILFMVWVSGPAKATKAAQKPSDQTPDTVGGLSAAEIASRLEQQRREQQIPSVPRRDQPKWSAGVPDEPGAVNGSPDSPVPGGQDPMKQEIRRREYTSRFASSVSLSYRQPQVATHPKAITEPTSSMTDLVALPASALTDLPSGAVVSTDTQASSTESPLKRRNPDFNQASGKDYVVFEGTVLETTLVTRLNGDFVGPVVCMLTTNIYSHDGQRVLIPAGTKVMGQARRVESVGQTRLAVTFHRLIMPDGFSADLNQFQGLNQIGETGLKDRVNHHYLEIFGASIAVGAIGGLSEAGTTTSSLGLPQSPTDSYRQGVASSFSQSSLHILDRFLNLLPTITIREGHRVKIYLTQDFLLPDYAQHEMPSNL